MQVVNRNNVGKNEIGWLKVAILIIAWMVIVSLAKDVWQIRTGFSRITESERRLVDEVALNASLKHKLDLVQTNEYREKLVRERLNMQKEGEVTVVMPAGNYSKSDTIKVSETPKTNWEKWWNLIH